MAPATIQIIDDFERLRNELARNHELEDGKLDDVSGNTLIHNRFRDALIALLHQYRSCGTKEVWIIDPDSRIAFLHSEALNTILREDGIFQSNLIPGFSTRIGDLFGQL